jgi:NTP pyrophosphatase (non-canonical NTP hydrolase)
MEYSEFVNKLMTHGRVIPDARIMHNVLAINSEAGELANAFIKQVGYTQPLNKKNVKEELGDLLFFIQDLCNIYGWSIMDLVRENTEKLILRYPTGEWTPEAAEKRADKEPPQKRDSYVDSLMGDIKELFQMIHEHEEDL